MPSRILREGILTSEAVNSLSESAEILYRRLMSVADDYGRYFGHVALVRAGCYPLQLETVSEAKVETLLSECQSKNLILLYSVAGKKYLEIKNFNQRTRTDSKYPAPCQQFDGHPAVIPPSESPPNARLVVFGDGVVEPPKSGGDPKDFIWTEGIKLTGVTRTFLGKLCKEYSENEVVMAIARTKEHSPADPKSFLLGCLKPAEDPAKGAI